MADERTRRGEPEVIVEGRSLFGQIRLGLGFVCAVFLVIFLLQNLDDAQIDFLWMDLEIPLIFALIAAAVLGAFASTLFGFFRRRAYDAEVRDRVRATRDRDEKK